MAGWDLDKLQQLSAQAAVQSPQNPNPGWSTLKLAALVATTQPGGLPPQFDNMAAMRKISDEVNAHTQAALSADPADYPKIHPLALQAYRKGMTVHDLGETRMTMGGPVRVPPDPSIQDVPETFLAEGEHTYNFKRAVMEVQKIQDPAEREEALQQLQLDYKKKRFEEAIAPINQYYVQKLIEEHDEEKHSGRIAGFLEVLTSEKLGRFGFMMEQQLKRAPDSSLARAAEFEDAILRGTSRIMAGGAHLVGAKDWARAFYLATEDPEFAPTVDPDWADKAINLVGEQVPYIVASTAAAAATGGTAAVLGAAPWMASGFGMVGSGIVSFGVEGNDAYQRAVDYGVDEQTARQIGFTTGLFSATIEMLGGGGTKYAGAVERVYMSKLKRLGGWSIDKVKTALKEALEEAGQEITQIAGESHYRNIDGEEAVERVMAASAAGFALGGMMDVALNPTSASKVRQAEETATLPTKDATPTAPPTNRLRPVTVEETDSGTMHILNILREAGVVEEEQVTVVGEARSLADEVQDGHITEDRALKMLQDAGLPADLPLAEARVIGRNFRDGANKAVIRLYQGHDATTVLHEVAEDYFKGVYGEDAATPEIGKLRKEYEDNTGDVRGGNNREWLADLATDYAVHNRIHEKAGGKLRAVFNKFRDVYIELLARVRNLRNNLRQGKVPVELQTILEAPFKGRQEVTEAAVSPRLSRMQARRQALATDPDSQRINTRAKQLEKEHVEWFKKYQKNPDRRTAQQIDRIRQQYNNLLGLDPADGRPFVPPEIGPELMEIEVHKPPTYKLAPAEEKLAAKHKTVMSPRAKKTFILSDGRMVPVSQDHDMTASEAGTSLKSVVNQGAIRTYREPGQVAVEHTKPLTVEQAESLQQWLVGGFEPGTVIAYQYGPDSYWMYAVANRMDVYSVIDDMRKRSAGTTPMIATYQLRREPTKPATVDQKTMGHVLSEVLGISEDDRRGLMDTLVGKDSMADMTFAEAGAVVEQLRSMAEERGLRLDGVKNFGDALAVVIDHYNHVRPDRTGFCKPNMVLDTIRSLKNTLGRSDIALGRMERITRSLTGYEEGALYRALYRDVREAQDAGEARSMDVEREFQRWWLTELTDSERKGIYHPVEVVPGKYLNGAQRMGIFIHSFNEDSLRHLTEGNGLTLDEISQIRRWMHENRPGEVRLAELWLQHAKDRFPELRDAHFRATGELLEEVDVYGPILVLDRSMEKQHDPLAAMLKNIEKGEPGRIGEVIERTEAARQPIELDFLKLIFYNNRKVSRYIEMAPAVSQMAKLLKNRNLRTSLNRALYGKGAELYSTWLEDTARGYTIDNGNIPNILKTVTNNATVFALGFKVTSAGVTTLSGFHALAYDPTVIPYSLKTMVEAPVFSPAFRRLEAEVYGLSNLMKSRNWDRYVAHLSTTAALEGTGPRTQKSLKRKMEGKRSWKELQLSFIKPADRATTLYAWYGHYRRALATGADQRTAVAVADRVIEKSQPMGSMADQPAAFRGGFLMRVLGRFKNQPNQVYNLIRHDIIGERKAGRISNAEVMYRTFMGVILPSVLMGVIRRGRLPEDWEELATDIVTYPVSSVLIAGDIISSLIKGYDPTGSILSLPVTSLDRARREFALANDSAKPETTRKHRKLGMMYLLESLSAATGAVPQSAFVAARGVADLLSGETSDPRRLIISKSTFEGKDEKDKPTSRMR